MKKSGWLGVMAAVVLAGCGSATSAAGGGGSASLSPSKAVWARSTTAGSAWSLFYGAAVDGSGRVYAAGELYDTATATFGTGISAAGTVAGDYSPLLVRYDADGTAVWARGADEGSDPAWFNTVCADSAGTVYAAGRAAGSTLHRFGTVSLTGGTTSNHPFLVKYSAAGSPVWGSIDTTGGAGEFYGAAAASGLITAAGYLHGTTTATFGAKTASPPSAFNNPLLVQYTAAGVPQWTATWSSSTLSGGFTAVAVDGSGNLYAVGSTAGDGTSPVTFGTASVTPVATKSAVLVAKFSSAGTPLWVRSVTSGMSVSGFTAVAVTSDGLYAAGWTRGSTSVVLGPGVAVAGSSTTNAPLLVKYSLDGTPLWAQSTTVGATNALFNNIAADPEGNVFCAGEIDTTSLFRFGPSVSAAGATAGINAVLVKYDAAGAAQWARSPSGADQSNYFGVAVSASGQMAVAGEIDGSAPYTFGSGVSAAGTSSYNSVVVGFVP